jgi:hypothetical protein
VVWEVGGVLDAWCVFLFFFCFFFLDCCVRHS